MRIGVLTGGGDCPGLNAVIRAVVRKGVDGLRPRVRRLPRRLARADRGPPRHRSAIQEVRGILPRGGTILGSSRTNPFKVEGGVERIEANLAALGVDALIAIGGEDTLGVATRLHEHGVHVVGVPKTIDNDLNATDYTFGFDTAVNIAMEAIDRLHTTAESHHRALIVEVMGRHAGWIALHAGMAGGANVDPHPGGAVRHRRGLRVRRDALRAPLRADHRRVRGRDAGRGRRLTLADGELDAFGHVRLGGIGDGAGEGDREAHRQGGADHGARPHPARRYADGASTGCWRPGSGCTPSTRSHDGDWGTMVALRGTDIVRVPLGDATTELKMVDPQLYAEAEVFFG